jgi:hypothetical protein
VILTSHQPIFLPWPGFFFKALSSDCMVLLDDVQFPRGTSWLNRNRLKNENGELWLTAPVWKKGRGLQIVRDVELYDRLDWRKKHLRSIAQNYANAPYFDEYFPIVERVYRNDRPLLVGLNMDVIDLLWEALSLRPKPLLQSSLGVKGRGTELIVSICERVGADRYALFPAAQKHVDVALMRERGIEPVYLRFHPPVYPQLWGAFIYNLSTLDLVLNCGPKSGAIISGA